MARVRTWHRARLALLGGTACGLLAGSIQVLDHFQASQLAAAIRMQPGAGVGRIAVDTLGGHVTLGAVALDRGDVRIRIGRIEAQLESNPVLGIVTQAVAQSAPAGGSSVTADDIRVEVGKVVFIIPHLTAEGSTLSAEDLARIFDAKQPQSLDDRLAKLSARSITAPEVRMAPSDPEAAAKNGVFTVRNVVLADVVAGKIKSAMAEGASVVGATNPDLKATLDIGKLAVSNLDVPLAAKILGGSRSDEAASQSAVYDSFSVSSVRYAETAPSTQTFSIGQVEGSGLKGRPLLVPISEFAARLDKAKEETSEEERRRTADLVLDAMRSLTVGHLGLHDMTFSETGKEKPVAVKLARIEIDADDVLRVGKFLVEGVSMSTSDVDMSFARFAVEGLDQSGLTDAIKTTGSLQQLESDVMQNPSLRPRVGKISLDGLHLEAPASELDGNSADGSHYIFDIPVVAIDTTSAANAVATGATSRIQVVYDVAPTAPSESLQALAKAGFGHLDITNDTAASYDPAKQTLQFERLSFLAKDLATLVFTGSLSNVSSDVFGPDKDVRLEALQKVKVAALQIAFGNQGMVDKILPVMAAQANMTIPAFKKDLKLKLRQIVLETLGEGPAATQIVNAGLAFIDKPKNFTLKLVAPKGLGLLEVAGAAEPKDVLNLMTVTATANQ